jgi:predicted  nucleic acid-binding Zn-ribbon protein
MKDERMRLDALRGEISRTQLERSKLEKEIEAITAEERKFAGQLPLVKKNEEYSALLHEIAGAKRRRSDRETDLLVLMETEERQQRERPALEKEVKAIEQEAGQRLEAFAAEEGREREAAAAVEAERAELVAKLSPSMRSRYERIRASREGRAVVPIAKGACGGCYRGQPPQVLQEARRGDRVLVCDGCGRLLIWPPETGA